MWDALGSHPRGIRDAALTDDLQLHLAVAYEDGQVWDCTAQLADDPAWTNVTAERAGPRSGSLPRSAYEVIERPGYEPGPGQVEMHYMYAKDAHGRTDHTVWVTCERCQSVVTLPKPIDWTSVLPYLAIFASVFTVFVDLLLAPVWVAWVLFTAGGHGPCWLPWCTE